MWGMWNCKDKRFAFGIKEPTKEAAVRALQKKIGTRYYPTTMSPREIPTNHANRENPRYRKKVEEVPDAD